MHTKQTIAVIAGNGSQGAFIAGKLARGNYRLLLYYTDENGGQSLLEEIKNASPLADVEAVPCKVDACWEADFILVDLPVKEEQELAEKIRTVANQKIVVSMAQDVYDGNSSSLASADKRAAATLQQLLPNCKLVKVFSSGANLNLATGEAEESGIVTVLTGNDKEALQTVFGLFSIAGLKPVVAGGLLEEAV